MLIQGLCHGCLNTVVWRRYVVTVLAGADVVTWREEFTGQQGSQLRFYGRDLHHVQFYKQKEDSLTPCWAE